MLRFPISRRLLPVAFAVIAGLTAGTSHSATIIVDAPGCTAGGTMAWDATNKLVYCQGAPNAPASSLGVTTPDCARGTAIGWNATTMKASCVTSTGASPASSLRIGVSLPDCVNGAVKWNAATNTLTCKIVVQALNVDGSTAPVYDALSDGLLVMRYMFGVRGAALTNKALGVTATRTDPTAIAAYLDSIRTTLDIDGNGAVDALTDGTMILRYMFGARGTALTNGAIGVGAFSGTPAAVEAKLQSLMP